jgi:hypothetical protein
LTRCIRANEIERDLHRIAVGLLLHQELDLSGLAGPCRRRPLHPRAGRRSLHCCASDFPRKPIRSLGTSPHVSGGLTTRRRATRPSRLLKTHASNPDNTREWWRPASYHGAVEPVKGRSKAAHDLPDFRRPPRFGTSRAERGQGRVGRV